MNESYMNTKKINKKRRRYPDINLIHFKSSVRGAIAKQLRDELEFTFPIKKDFAKLMRKSPSQISKWLGGDHNFTIETLCEISYAIRMPITELLLLTYLGKLYKNRNEFCEIEWK